MKEPVELQSKIHEAIKVLCEKGDKLADAHNYEQATEEYKKAWELVPEPKNDWEASTWILAAIADACFFGGYKTSAREALEYAFTCPGGQGNPFLHLRYGQILYDCGEEQSAARELMLAYMGGGGDIFQSEDPRYFSFLKTKAIIE